MGRYIYAIYNARLRLAARSAHTYGEKDAFPKKKQYYINIENYL